MKKRQYKKVKKRPPGRRGRSIEKRSPEIDDRAEIGHWEMDCVEGKKKTKETLLVLTERKARKEIMVKMKDKTTGSVVAALDRLERRYGKLFSKVFQTITVDNGTEFSDVAGLERSCLHKGKRTTVFYCHPYSSYERGTNENTNGMIRRWFQRGPTSGRSQRRRSRPSKTAERLPARDSGLPLCRRRLRRSPGRPGLKSFFRFFTI